MFVIYETPETVIANALSEYLNLLVIEHDMRQNENGIWVFASNARTPWELKTLCLAFAAGLRSAKRWRIA